MSIEYIKRLTGYYEVDGYGWIIDKDHIGPEIFGDDTGTIGPGNVSDNIRALLEAGAGERFRMLDDDGELYYEGRIILPPLDHPSWNDGELNFRPISDFGVGAGCTSIQY